MMSEMTFLDVLQNGGDFRVGIDTILVGCTVHEDLRLGLLLTRRGTGDIRRPQGKLMTKYETREIRIHS